MIRIILHKISQEEIIQLCKAHFGGMAKFVADIDRGKLAVGGEMYADGENLLLQEGSRQSSLWGGNFYPWKDGPQRIEYTSFINIRPADDNWSMELGDEKNRRSVRELVERFLLADDETMEHPE